MIRGRTPCAYAAANVTLKPGQSVTITSAYGQTRDVETFNNVIIPAITARSFVQKKLIEAEELTERLTKGVKMVSGSPLFDGFVKQSYLDNLLRGGVPSIMGDAEDPKVSVELNVARETNEPFARRVIRMCSAVFAMNASLSFVDPTQNIALLSAWATFPLRRCTAVERKQFWAVREEHTKRCYETASNMVESALL